MENTKQRALRRHHRQRMIRRAYRSYALSHWEHKDPDWLRRQVMRWYNNMAICSRKHYKRPPAQERRLHEAARYELREIGL